MMESQIDWSQGGVNLWAGLRVNVTFQGSLRLSHLPLVSPPQIEKRITLNEGELSNSGEENLKSLRQRLWHQKKEKKKKH